MITSNFPELADPGLRKLVYKRAIEKYGQDMQLVIAMEELAELQKEVSKVIRGKWDFGHLLEELADVRIMVEQIEMMFNLGPAVVDEMCRKMNRLVQRMDKEDAE